jgi:hypothetical protein
VKKFLLKATLIVKELIKGVNIICHGNTEDTEFKKGERE